MPCRCGEGPQSGRGVATGDRERSFGAPDIVMTAFHQSPRKSSFEDSVSKHRRQADAARWPNQNQGQGRRWHRRTAPCLAQAPGAGGLAQRGGGVPIRWGCERGMEAATARDRDRQHRPPVLRPWPVKAIRQVARSVPWRRKQNRQMVSDAMDKVSTDGVNHRRGIPLSWPTEL